MTVKEFYDSLATNADLEQKIKECKTPEDAYAVAKDAGLSESLEDFVKFSEELNAQYKEMSPEEIESVSAAGDTITTLTTTTTVTASASGAVAAAV